MNRENKKGRSELTGSDQERKNTSSTVANLDLHHKENLRQEKIAARRAQIPRSYRAVYNRAIKGRSLRAAINAQCLECCCWQRKEITLCTSLACPLYTVRPYQLPQNGREGQVSGAESQKPE